MSVSPPRSPLDAVEGGSFARLRRRSWPIWVLFALTHLGLLVGTFPYFVHGSAGGDVSVYQGWAHRVLVHGSWPVLDTPWVYPAGALVLVLLPAILGLGLYQVTWLVLMAGANALALSFLISRGKKRWDLTGAWFFVGTTAILAPVALMRLEGFTAVAVLIALLLLTTRPRLAGFLLAAASWIKVWPAAVVLAAVVASSKRWVVVATGAITSVVVVLVVVIGGGASHLTSFVGAQDGRPLQVEAPLSTPWLWMAVSGVPGAAVFHDHALITEEVTGPGDSWLVTHSTMIMLVVMVALVVVLAIAVRRLSSFARPVGRELDLVLLAAVSLATAFIVFNKVVSPQYLLWLTPIVAVGLLTKPQEWRTAASLLVAATAFTTLVYPVLYDQLLALNPVVAGLLGLRNVLLVVLFGWSAWKLGVAAFVRPPVPLGTRPFGATVRSTSY